MSLATFWKFLTLKCSLEKYSNQNGLTCPSRQRGGERIKFKSQDRLTGLFYTCLRRARYLKNTLSDVFLTVTLILRFFMNSIIEMVDFFKFKTNQISFGDWRVILGLCPVKLISVILLGPNWDRKVESVPIRTRNPISFNATEIDRRTLILVQQKSPSKS